MLTAVTLRDFWLDDVLPFSCCPMFMLPRNIYDEWPKWCASEWCDLPHACVHDMRMHMHTMYTMHM